MQYYIVFRNTPNKFLKTILKKGFQHCYIVYNDDYNWIRINPHNDYLHIDILPFDVDDYSFFDDKKYIQHIVEHKDSQILHIVPTLINCVTMCKYIIGLRGIRSFFIWTPWQLYKYLQRVKL